MDENLREIHQSTTSSSPRIKSESFLKTSENQHPKELGPIAKK